MSRIVRLSVRLLLPNQRELLLLSGPTSLLLLLLIRVSLTSACRDAAVSEGRPEWPPHLYKTTGIAGEAAAAFVMLQLLLLLLI
jgi:hypothetical protein